MAKTIKAAFVGFIGQSICGQGNMIELRIIKTKVKAQDITPSWEDICRAIDDQESKGDQQFCDSNCLALQNWPVGN